MKPFDLISKEQAAEPARKLLEETHAQLGRVPNLYAAMANSPAALEGYLAFRKALQGGSLSVKMREFIALLTAQENSCEYCVSAHSFRLGKLGVNHEASLQTRQGHDDDAKTDIALQFVQTLLRKQGQVEPGMVEMLLQAGWTEAEIGEMAAHVALNVLSNYFNHIAAPALDFPLTSVKIG